ncbi:MAG: hypothetical protein ACYC75_01590 [Minisyncoccota bacterium]
MTSHNGGGGDQFEKTVPERHQIQHYHGDSVRVLFFVSAIVLIVAESTGADLPLSTTGAVISAIVLVVAAGITNPTQFGIHWFNALMAVAGTLLFGTSAIDHYRAGMSVFDPSFAYIEALALLSLAALYFTVRTIRGFRSRPNLS